VFHQAILAVVVLFEALVAWRVVTSTRQSRTEVRLVALEQRQAIM